MAQLSHLYMTTRKSIPLTGWTFVGKVMSLLYNMLSRFFIAFLPSSKCLWISWLHSPSAVILEPKKIKYMVYVCAYMLVAQSCLTLCDPMDCSLPGSSVHGILQTRLLQWVFIPFSRGSFRPRDWTWVSYIVGRFFTVWATRETLYTHTHTHTHPIVKLLLGRKAMTNLDSIKKQRYYFANKGPSSKSYVFFQ